LKFKLDENFGVRGTATLAAHGHDVATVVGQNLCSSSDVALLDICREEGRCLVTFDLDFSNPLRFPPRRYAGIAVVRIPARSGLAEINAALETLVAAVGTSGIEGKLWIVELDRIREYADEWPDDKDDGP
jgi:predicted nuclease of predicted toxin-antitoxin system